VGTNAQPCGRSDADVTIFMAPVLSGTGLDN
jgi:hypothetical protein